MRKVAVIGVGLHAYGKWNDKKPKDLAQTAVTSALKGAGVRWEDVGSAWCGHTSLGMTAGARLFQQFGPTGLSITNVENASATGSYAFRGAYNDVASGEFEIALALGIDMLPRRDPKPRCPQRAEARRASRSRARRPRRCWSSRAMRKAHMEKYGTTIDQTGAGQRQAAFQRLRATRTRSTRKK